MDDKTIAPLCPCCRKPMKLVRTIEHVGWLPELSVFYCAECQQVATMTAARPAGSGLVESRSLAVTERDCTVALGSRLVAQEHGPWLNERVGGLANASTASPLRQLSPVADMRSDEAMSEKCHERTRAGAAKGNYSMTSSARPSSVIGKVRPRALAVLRLMMNSTFTTCWTGKSAGFAPLRSLAA